MYETQDGVSAIVRLLCPRARDYVLEAFTVQGNKLHCLPKSNQPIRYSWVVP